MMENKYFKSEMFEQLGGKQLVVSSFVSIFWLSGDLIEPGIIHKSL